ncbi:hypothetical protein [Legionella fairfieldensis]|uniref:hypothetical protein n=1 Tax=Legionella fairfieldensis TaxID=45064 RepID=UPI00048E9C37|nr:hypothetical protein [Legionella fairfieldensis]
MWLTLAITSVLSLVCLLFLRSGWQQHAAIRTWRKAFAINKHLLVYQQLYADVDGFALSKAARTNQDALEYVYGEIDFESFVALLGLCKPDISTVFYDLGSGTGKAVLACAMVFNVQKCCGVELFASLHQSALKQQQRLSHIPAYRDKAARIEFKQANFFDTQFTDASLIFVNATAFLGETWLALSKHIEQVKPGAVVISTTKSLRSNLFTLLTRTQVAMSWGIVEAFIQKRLGWGD